MDQREVEAMIKSLQKALIEKDGVADVISIMEKLKKDVVPSEDLLRVRSLILADTGPYHVHSCLHTQPAVCTVLD